MVGTEGEVVGEALPGGFEEADVVVDAERLEVDVGGVPDVLDRLGGLEREALGRLVEAVRGGLGCLDRLSAELHQGGADHGALVVGRLACRLHGLLLHKGEGRAKLVSVVLCGPFCSVVSGAEGVLLQVGERGEEVLLVIAMGASGCFGSLIGGAMRRADGVLLQGRDDDLLVESTGLSSGVRSVLAGFDDGRPEYDVVVAVELIEPVVPRSCGGVADGRGIREKREDGSIHGNVRHTRR